MGGNADMSGSLLRAGMDLGRNLARSQGRDNGDAAEAAVIQARTRAAEEREAGREQASLAQEQARRHKARRMTRQGTSGLALSGSPLLVAAAESASGEDEIQKALDQGRARASAAEGQGRLRAASLRRRDGSLLSLGASLWDF